jgi:hypothetical protein
LREWTSRPNNVSTGRRLLRDLRARNCGERSVTRQHARTVARLASATCGRRPDWYRGAPVPPNRSTRAFAFSLAGAKDLDEPLDLAHVGSNRLEPFLLGGDPGDRRCGFRAQQP